MIEVKVWEDITTGNRHFEGMVPAKDLREVKLDGLDRMVVESPEESAADIFQTLEILARRISEQQKEPATKNTAPNPPL